MNEFKEVLKKNTEIVNHYGVIAQIPVWIEVMSELTKNLCKWLRKYDELEGDISLQLLADMKEEITDVTICLDQLKYTIAFMEDDLEEEYKYKVNRQHQRIAKLNEIYRVVSSNKINEENYMKMTDWIKKVIKEEV